MDVDLALCQSPFMVEHQQATSGFSERPRVRACAIRDVNREQQCYPVLFVPVEMREVRFRSRGHLNGRASAGRVGALFATCKCS